MDKIELKVRLDDLKRELQGSTLVAVSKYSPIEDVAFAYSVGQLDFGENRVSDLLEKAEYFKAHNYSNVRWHFIGQLQTNKVKDLLKIPNLWAIHSVSSKKIVEELIKREHEFVGLELKLFFQLNTSNEDEKSGFESVIELIEAMKLVTALPKTKFKVFGLMTMGAIRTENFQESALKSFKELKIAREKIGTKDLKLSMGMSQDYKIALSEGADFIRVGSLLFK
jgi:hypothetical protein